MARQKTAAEAEEASHDRLSIRLDLESGARIGPGKITVLEEIARSGSLSAAGRAMGMSYRRIWELVDDLNRSLGAVLVEKTAGGSGGGGAVLTEAGRAVITCYHGIEDDAERAAAPHIARLRQALAGG